MMTTAEGGNNGTASTAIQHRIRLFSLMERYPWPFVVALPSIFVLLIGLGLFSREDIIADVANLWIPSDGTYAKNKKYAERVGATIADEYTVIAAMAVGRHGENLFTEENLNTIIERMQRVEGIQVCCCRSQLLYLDLHPSFSVYLTHNNPMSVDFVQGQHVYMGRCLLSKWYQ